MAKVWKIAPGEGAKHWDVCHEAGCIAVGWRHIPDFAAFDTKEDVLSALQQEYQNAKGCGKGAAKMILQFVKEVKQGDVVVANRGYHSVVGIGRVESEYLRPASLANPLPKAPRLRHARKVRWLVEKEIRLPGNNPFFLQPTLTPLALAQCERIKRRYLNVFPDDRGLRKNLEGLFADVSDTEEENTGDTHAKLADAEKQLAELGAFDPSNITDARQRVLSSVVRRRGQYAFRNRLLYARWMPLLCHRMHNRGGSGSGSHHPLLGERNESLQQRTPPAGGHPHPL